MWRRCACDTHIERCECANNYAWVRHRKMPILCVYMRERSSSLLVCVWERERGERETERGASVTQQPSLSIRPSLAWLHATHASTRTFWHPHPAHAHLKAHTNLREYPFLSLGLFSLNIWHTHTQTHAAQHTHTHTHSPEHTIHPHPRLYGDHSRLCFFAPQHAQHLNLQRGHRADRRRRPHRARECGVIWKQGDVTTADWFVPPPSLFLAQNYQSLSPPHKIVNPSTHEILPLSSMFFQLSHQTCCLFSFHIYRITYITCLHLYHRPKFFLSLSLSLCVCVCVSR